MQNLSQVWCTLALLCLSGILGGCAAFPQYQVPVRDVHERNDYPANELAYVDLRFYEGNPEDPHPDDLEYSSMTGIARQAFIDSGRYQDVTFQRPSLHSSVPRYRLSIYDETPLTVPALTGLLCVLTYDLFPMIASQHFYVSLQQLDPQTGAVLQESHNTDTIHAYFGWLAIPAWALGHTHHRAINDTLENQIKGLLQKKAGYNADYNADYNDDSSEFRDSDRKR